MVRAIVDTISMVIPITSMLGLVSPMEIILQRWESVILPPRKRVLILLALPVLMTGPLSGSISIRTVILSGMETMDRKFYVPEAIQMGNYCLSTDYHYSTNQRTVNLSPGDYKFVFIHIEYGGGSGNEFRFGTPSIAFPTRVKPADLSTGRLVVDPEAFQCQRHRDTA